MLDFSSSVFFFFKSVAFYGKLLKIVMQKIKKSKLVFDNFTGKCTFHLQMEPVLHFKTSFQLIIICLISLKAKLKMLDNYLVKIVFLNFPVCGKNYEIPRYILPEDLSAFLWQQIKNSVTVKIGYDWKRSDANIIISWVWGTFWVILLFQLFKKKSMYFCSPWAQY